MQTVFLPRFIINQILQHAQQQSDTGAFGYLTRNAQQTLNSHIFTGNLSAFLQFLQISETVPSMYAIYCSPQTIEDSKKILMQLNKQLLYLEINRSTRGVLEVLAHSWQNQAWQLTQLELIETN